MFKEKQTSNTDFKKKLEENINMFLGIGYSKKEIDAVRELTSDFKKVLSKIPPQYEPTDEQKAFGVSHNTKNFLFRTLYILPDKMRKELVKDDECVNLIINLYASKYPGLFTADDMSVEELDDLFYHAWFYFRLRQRHHIEGAVNDLAQVFSQSIFIVASGLLKKDVDKDNFQKLTVLSDEVTNLLKPKSALPLFVHKAFGKLASQVDQSSVYDAAKKVREFVGRDSELYYTTQNDLDSLQQTGFKVDYVEVIARYLGAHVSMKGNDYFKYVHNVVNSLGFFIESAAKHNWTTKGSSLLTIDDYELYIAVVFMIVDPAQNKTINEFAGRFIAMCYISLLTDNNNLDILDHPDLEDFFLDMADYFAQVTQNSFEELATSNPQQIEPVADPVNNSQPNQENTMSTIQNQNNPVTQPANEAKIIHDTTSNAAQQNEKTVTVEQLRAQAEEKQKELHMKNNAGTPVPPFLYDIIVDDQEMSNYEKMELQIVALKKATKERDDKIDEAFSELNSRQDKAFMREKLLMEEVAAIKKEVFGESAMPILDRIRARAKEGTTVSSSSSSSGSDLSTTETVLAATAVTVAAAAIGYSLYTLFVED